MVYTLLVVLFILMLLGYPGLGLHAYGPWPSSAAGVVLLVLVILLLMGRI